MTYRPRFLLALTAAVAMAAWAPWGWQEAGSSGEEALVRIAPGRFSYRLPGEFSRGGRPVDAPLHETALKQPLTVMRHQVSEAEYESCVMAGSCKARARPHMTRPDYPVTGVSWEDARAYVQWLSRRTGHVWRLPSDAEWSYVAGSRYHDDALLIGEDAGVIQRWIARYEKEARRETLGNEPERIGSFGANDHGLGDLSGNVWEWTDTCFTRQELSGDAKPFVVCGIRIAAGQHRAYVSDFIRDARGGGCAVGIPPTNLGFRLIRDEPTPLWDRMVAWIWPGR